MSDQKNLLSLYQRAIDHLKHSEKKTLSAIAKETGISRTYLSQVYNESNGRKVTDRLIHTLKSVYGINISDPDKPLEISPPGSGIGNTFKIITEVIIIQGKAVSSETKIEPLT